MESFTEVVAFEDEVGLGAESIHYKKTAEHGKALEAEYLLGMIYTVLTGVAIIVPRYLQFYPHQDTPGSPNALYTFLLWGLCSQMNEFPASSIYSRPILKLQHKSYLFHKYFPVPQIGLIACLSVSAV